MTNQPIDVVGVGNAIVDVISQATDAFLEAEGLAKGSMTLIDRARADELYDHMGPAIEASGGSAANSLAGIGSFGASTAFIGKVSDDQLGRVFAHDMRATGVAYDVPPAVSHHSTGRSLILVTPDAQRTMNTYLGIASLLEPGDVDPALVQRARFLFWEGYLWDVESAKQAIRKAMDLSRAAGNKVVLSTSDSFCVERHHQEFLELIAGPVDILFANESELNALYQCDFDDAVEKVRGHVELGCLTRGPAGSVLVTADATIEIPAEPVTEVVDTTGAGDQYAAGVLYALTRDMDLERAGRLGSLAAAEVISHVGPRPLRPLSGLL